MSPKEFPITVGESPAADARPVRYSQQTMTYPAAPTTRISEAACSAMVALDEEGKPRNVPKLVVEDEVQLRRYHDAVQRREARLRLAKQRRARR